MNASREYRETRFQWRDDPAEMLRTIFERVPECIKVIGLDGAVVRMNPAGLRMLEAEDPSQVVGRSMTDFVVAADRERVAAWIRRCAEGEAEPAEFAVEGLRGARRSLWSQAVPMKDRSGRVRSVLAVTRDVTAARRAELDRLQEEQAMRQLYRMDALGRLAGGVAHDFNNILTAIMGYGELLLEDVRGKGAAERHAEEILKAAESARRLCRQMLTFSLGQGSSRREVLDPGKILMDLEGMLRPILGERITLRREIPGDLWEVRADRSALEQVLLNLAVNARDAMPEGGALTVALRNQLVGAGEEPPPGALAPGRYVAISVSDTGRGMPPDVLAHLFEPYFTTKESGRGGGLGLSIVFGIVGQASGHVDVASRPGEGSTFTVYLPAVEPALGPPAAPRPSPVILLVEDAPDVRRLVRGVLASRGRVVVAAVSAEDALAELAARRAEVGLLLTDLSLPGIGGAELAARARDLVPGLKVIAMSGDPAPGPEVTRWIDRFIAKPFGPDELARAVDALMGE